MYAQDTWRLEAGPHARLRRALLALPAADRQCNNHLVDVRPGLLRRRRRRRRTRRRPARCSTTTTGDPTNGMMIAGVNSPYGDAIYKFQKNSIQPRVGVSWDPIGQGTTIVRGVVRRLLRPAAGRHLRAERVHQPAVQQQHEHDRAVAEQPGRRLDADHARPASPGRGTSADFKNPRTMQWNIGVTQAALQERRRRSRATSGRAATT